MCIVPLHIEPNKNGILRILFSAFNGTFGGDVEFEDPYASQLAVHCGVKPFDPHLDSFDFIWSQPGRLTFPAKETVARSPD